MDIINVHSLYSSFKKNINKSPCQIIGTMKSLTISNNNYSHFYNSATNFFQRKTFKIPNETNYPIFNESQRKFISIKKKLNTFSFHDKNSKPNVTSITKKVFSKVQKSMTCKKKKKTNFFICDNYYGGRNNLFSKNYNKKFRCTYSRNNHRPPDFYSNFHTFKNIYPLEEIKNPEERIKDFFMFLNTIFIQDNYNNLKYNENEIFGHQKTYLEYIKDEFNYFFYKEKELSMKSYYYQTFKTKDYGKVELFLKSARIDIIDESITNKNVIISINIPFNLMGLIYIANIEQINQIIFFLLNKIKIDQNNDNILSEDELKKIFLELLTNIKYEDDNIKIELNPKDYERFYAQIFFLEKIQIVSDTIRFNYFLSDFNKNPKNVVVVNDNGIYKTFNSIKKNKIIFYNDINYHKLLLISQNNNNYKIKFSMPEISMIFNDYEKQLNHCIDKELFIYLYQNNFMDWDFYILHYLFFQKNFRLFIGRVLSIKNNYNLFLTKKIINLENNKIEFSPIMNFKEENKKISNAINNSYKKYYLINNNHFSGIGINENDYEYIFTNLIEGKINICKLKSYTLYAFINNINKPKIYEFNFNFKQMRILFFKSLFNDFDLFLKRLLFIKNENIYFDYSFLESYYSMTNNEMYELFNRTNQSDQKRKKGEENSIINSITFMKLYLD